ncbi:SR1 protein [Paenibacillus sp. cl141a]|uniref:GapA-binding peptide SR1P n=1 Tax=Paenibacillus sp. cl141a TaxID=1761877 RepID=UPI0008D0F841|nr:GapA-binding peptide SR1P [Paenibacillus sp. cl141a]SEK85974.1 SR1 protein [Paenibacillus sp. cl141a]
MKALTSPVAAKGKANEEWGLIICSRCDEMVDTIPTDGVKIIYGFCGKGECKGTDLQD